ncbi:DNA-3-methyladenine glycosylase family protein [Brevundimonas sp.]|uniref:DNA-3-methyladenine glycosylase family protein n=1 Tax=Brevundimonas sp. TaxID=1871086 RepID=UPI003F6E9C39
MQGVIATLYADESLASAERDSLVRQIDRGYGLNEDLETFLRIAQSEPSTAEAAALMHGMRMSCPENLFEISVVSLLLQNTTIARTTQMMRNILQRYGTAVEFDGQSLMTFPAPSAVADASEAELREVCRLGYRAKYVPAFATFFMDHDEESLWANEPDQVMALLQTIKGVGPYTSGVIASHCVRDFSRLSLDVWNTPIASTALFGHPDADHASVAAGLDQRFSGFSGLALLYMTELIALETPLVPLTEAPS